MVGTTRRENEERTRKSGEKTGKRFCKGGRKIKKPQNQLKGTRTKIEFLLQQIRPESHLGLRSRLDLAPKRLESRLSHHLMTLPDLMFS